MDVASGIYKIENKMDGKIYIGSSNNILRRWARHRRELANNIHDNVYLQRAWNKHLEINFSFEKIEDVNREQDLLIREQWFLDNVIQWGRDYNIATSAMKPIGFHGRKHSPDSIEKMKNRPFSEETRKKLSEGQSGENNHRAKLSAKDVLEIRRIWDAKKYTQKEISKKYNVCRANIGLITNRKTWKDI